MLGFRQRLDAQLRFQHRLTLMKSLHRGRAVIGEVMQPHQPPVRVLRDRVAQQKLPRPPERCRVIAGLLESVGFAHTSFAFARFEALPSRQYPFKEFGAIVKVDVRKQLTLERQSGLKIVGEDQ